MEASRDQDLVGAITAMTEAEVCQFIRRESKSGRLSRMVRRLNDDVLSADQVRRSKAKQAIRKLGFI